MNNQMTEDLERVTARAVECGAVTIGEPDMYVSVKLNGHIVFTPDDLLTFEQATLKEANERIARLEAALRKIAGMQIVEQFEILEGIDLNDPRR